MDQDQRHRARAGTREEIEAYRRRQGGGDGGDKEPKGLKTIIDTWSRAMRKDAEALLRKNDQQHSNMFNTIAKGGVKGAVQAWLVIRSPGLNHD